MIIKSSLILASMYSAPFIENDVHLMNTKNYYSINDEFFYYKEYSPTLNYKIIDMEEISKNQTKEILDKIMIESIEKFDFK